MVTKIDSFKCDICDNYYISEKEAQDCEAYHIKYKNNEKLAADLLRRLAFNEANWLQHKKENDIKQLVEYQKSVEEKKKILSKAP